MLCKSYHHWLSSSLKQDWIWLFTVWKMKALKKLLIWSRIWTQQIQDNILLRPLLCYNMVRRKTHVNTWNLPNSCSKLSVPAPLNVTLFQVDNVWPHVSFYWNNLTMFLYIWTPSKATSNLMMTSTGIMPWHVLLQATINKQKAVF